MGAGAPHFVNHRSMCTCILVSASSCSCLTPRLIRHLNSPFSPAGCPTFVHPYVHLQACDHRSPDGHFSLENVHPRKRYLLGGGGLRNSSSLHERGRNPACLLLFPFPTSRHPFGHIIQPKDRELFDGHRLTCIAQSGGDSQKNSNRLQFVQLELEMERPFRIFNNRTHQCRQQHGQGSIDIGLQSDFHGSGKESMQLSIKGGRRYLRWSHSCTASTRIPFQEAICIEGGV